VSVAKSISSSGRGERKRIGEHHAALGIAVRDLDGYAVRGAHDFLRPERARTDLVFGDREPAINVVRSAQLTECEQRADRDGAALHVRVHVVHALVRFEIDAAGIETDAFADEREPSRLASLRCAVT
jgi:hypothetical protein